MTVSFHRRALASCVALALSSPAIAATLFSENFQTRIDPDTQLPVLRCSPSGGAGTYPFPDGWLLRNVDNLTPNAQVAYVNEAWEVREDFQLDNNNCVAFSTSFYSPAGTANDWMWTPVIGPIPAGGGILSWKGHAYDSSFLDGYEVRVMTAPTVPTGGTGIIGNQITNSTVIFSTAAETKSWTTHIVDLSAYQGQSIYIGFRNNTVDKFIVVLDDIKVGRSADLAAQAGPQFAVAYPRVPAGISVNANYNVLALNLGATDLTNVVASVQPTFNGSPQGAPQPTASVPSLAMGGSATFSVASTVVLSQPGTWGVTYTVSSNQPDNDPSDNTLQVVDAEIGGNEWARHEGPPSGQLGIGANNGGELGTTFTLQQTATFEGIRFGLGSVAPGSTWPGRSVVANLRATDGTGAPAALIATTTSITSTFIGGTYDVKFVGGAQTLGPGTYFVGVVEPNECPDPMPLNVSTSRFILGTNWAIWPTIPGNTWQPLESVGTGHKSVPNVSLLTEVSLFKNDFELHTDPPAGRVEDGPAEAKWTTTRNPAATTALAAPRH